MLEWATIPTSRFPAPLAIGFNTMSNTAAGIIIVGCYVFAGMIIAGILTMFTLSPAVVMMPIGVNLVIGIVAAIVIIRASYRKK